MKRSGSEYRKVYDDYKNRYQNRIEWRTYEGYTIPESYAEAHLGMAPHGYNEADMRPVE